MTVNPVGACPRQATLDRRGVVGACPQLCDGRCLSTTGPVGSSSRPESGLGPLPGPIPDHRSHNVCYVKLEMAGLRQGCWDRPSGSPGALPFGVGRVNVLPIVFDFGSLLGV
jgi:hypothetical protein